MSRNALSFSGIVAMLPGANINTDAIIPIEFCVNRERPNFDVGLFHHWRFDTEGNQRTSFILNRSPWSRANILVAGSNFGCGSSREMAVWALADFGINCVIAPSFGEIFYNNCFLNGVLAAVIDLEVHQRLVQLLKGESVVRLSVDIGSKTVSLEGSKIASFQLDSLRQRMLQQALDPIDATMTFEDDITSFEEHSLDAHPWMHEIFENST